jgi:hypothetical protein
MYGEPVQQSNTAQQIVNGITNDVGAFARGAAQGAQEYEATHPHGSMTGYIGDKPVWINY